ncbi:MAG: autotransporter-associated beta strand repeat-containing protein [Pirellulaceae bacterium]
MLLSASGTHTVSGGTLAFGNTPGVIFGSTTINSAMTGNDGLIHASGTLTLAGDMSGLNGALTANGTGTTNLNTNTFAGPIQVRTGTLSLGVNQTGSNLGAITLGVPENSDDLLYGVPTLTYSTGVTQVDRDIIVDNGGANFDGLLPSDSMVAHLAPAAYSTDRTFTGDITLNSDLAIYGGSATGSNTGWNHFQGNISGNSRLLIRNGRASFDAQSTWSNSGGMVIGATGNSVQVAFMGTGTGNGNISLFGSTTGVMGLVRYSNDLSFGGGAITVASAGTTGLTFEPMASSNINNQINLNHTGANVFVDTAAGVVANWSGQINGNGRLNKNGAGTWIISNNTNTYTGAINVNSGSLIIDGNLAASSNIVSVSATSTLGGSGTIDRNVAMNGHLAPGNSPGILTINGDLSMSSTSALDIELNGGVAGTGYDRVVVNGLVNITDSTLNLVAGYDPLLSHNYFLLVNDGVDAITGTFAGLAEGSTVNFDFNGNSYSRILTYTANFEGGSFTGGNDIALFNAVPEPGHVVFGLLGLGLLASRRRSRAK